MREHHAAAIGLLELEGSFLWRGRPEAGVFVFVGQDRDYALRAALSRERRSIAQDARGPAIGTVARFFGEERLVGLVKVD